MSTSRLGHSYERVAEEYLAQKGARPLCRNYRAAGGEIDLIVAMDGVTVFVEVKQRATGQKGTPGEAIDRRKRTRICRAALCYLKQHGLLDQKVRFDAVLIDDGEIRHIPAAFPFTDGTAP